MKHLIIDQKVFTLISVTEHLFYRAHLVCDWGFSGFASITAPSFWSGLSEQHGFASVFLQWWSWGSASGLGGRPQTERVQTWESTWGIYFTQQPLSWLQVADLGYYANSFCKKQCYDGLSNLLHTLMMDRNRRPVSHKIIKQHRYIRFFWKRLKTKFWKFLFF